MGASILLSFWRIHKGREEVLRLLKPFMARGAAPAGWNDPMALGFLMTLATGLAERAAGPLAADALGNLQVELWSALTGLPSESVGERIVMLSASNDPGFTEGCRRALAFATVLVGRGDATTDPDNSVAEPDALLAQSERQAMLIDLWGRCLSDSASPQASACQDFPD